MKIYHRKDLRVYAILITSILWFPHSLARVSSLRYDWDIYYLAGLGIHTEGYYYAWWTHYFFVPFSLFGYVGGFVLLYGLIVSAWIALIHKADNPALFVFSFYPMLLCLELGQIAPVLAWICLTPLGAVLATAFKPYLVIFVLVHLYLLWPGRYWNGVKKSEPRLPDSWLHNWYLMPPGEVAGRTERMKK